MMQLLCGLGLHTHLAAHLVIRIPAKQWGRAEALSAA
jgi:hypothetical protein